MNFGQLISTVISRNHNSVFVKSDEDWNLIIHNYEFQKSEIIKRVIYRTKSLFLIDEGWLLCVIRFFLDELIIHGVAEN